MNRSFGGNQKLEGLIGWLIPLGLYLSALVIIAAVNFFTTLSPLLDPEIQANPALMGDGLMAAAIGSTLGYALLFTCSAWAVVLFFLRHVRFPFVMVAVLVVNTLLRLAEVLMMLRLLPGEPLSYDVIVLAALSTAVWVLYLSSSRRVARTFRMGRPWKNREMGDKP